MSTLLTPAASSHSLPGRPVPLAGGPIEVNQRVMSEVPGFGDGMLAVNQGVMADRKDLFIEESFGGQPGIVARRPT